MVSRSVRQQIQTAITNVAVKQAIVRGGKASGNLMIASGSSMMARREPFVTQTIIGKYEPRIGGMTANERFLSEAAYENFKRERPGYIRKVGDQGPPTETQRFSTVIEIERGRTKPKWFTPGGKVVADPKGPGFLQSETDFEGTEKRRAAYRRSARFRVAGGAVLRYGIAPLMYIYGIHSMYSRIKSKDLLYQEEYTDAYGPIIGTTLAVAADFALQGGLAPLPEIPNQQEPGIFGSKPPIFYSEGIF
jgi:hypothetical protein